MESLLSQDIWVAAILGSIVTATLNSIYRRLSAIMVLAKHHSRQRIRVWYYKRVKRKLLRIQEAHCDPLVAQRELSRCATYHALFLASIALFPCVLISVLVAFPEVKAAITETMAICSIPIFAFEIPWVVKSKFLDDLTKYRKRKRERQTRGQQNDSMAAVAA